MISHIRCKGIIVGFVFCGDVLFGADALHNSKPQPRDEWIEVMLIRRVQKVLR